MDPNGAVCPGPVLRPRVGESSQPHGNGSRSRPHPRRETIEESIGIYSSCSTRSDIEREASVCVTISIYLLSLEIQSRSISIDLE